MGSQYFWGKRSQMGQFEYPCFVPFHLKFPLSDTCPFSVLFFIWDQTRISRADISKKIPSGITQRQRLFISWGVYFSLSENKNNLLFLRYWRIVTYQGKGQSSAMNHVMSGHGPSGWSHLHSIMMSCVLIGAWDFTSPCFTHFYQLTFFSSKRHCHLKGSCQKLLSGFFPLEELSKCSSEMLISCPMYSAL